MSKVLTASCVAGVVTISHDDVDVPVPGAEILSEGVGDSEGLVILDEDRAYYLPNGAPDLAETLDHVIEALEQTKTALDKIGSALTAIDTHAPLITSCGAGAGTATVTPVAAADITALATAATAIETAKTQLETLSEALR